MTFNYRLDKLMKSIVSRIVSFAKYQIAERIVCEANRYTPTPTPTPTPQRVIYMDDPLYVVISFK